jgi:hypothetical protein
METHAQAFAELLERWHDFYLMAGTAAVTLMGLLFVGLSIHLDAMVRGDAIHVRAVALEAFYNFFFVLLIALVMLVPDPSERPTGTLLAAIGALRLVLLARNLRGLPVAAAHGFERGHVWRRSVASVIGYVLLMVTGILLARRAAAVDALTMMLATTVMLLATATRSAWDVIVRVGEAKHRAQEG